LYGAPGTSKTPGARIVASQSGLRFVTICGGDLQALGPGAGIYLRQLLDSAKAGRSATIVIIDEADVMISERDEIASNTSLSAHSCFYVLLQAMRDSCPNLTVILTTSRPLLGIDVALLDRMDRVQELSLPNEELRLEFALRRALALFPVPYLAPREIEIIKFCLEPDPNAVKSSTSQTPSQAIFSVILTSSSSGKYGALGSENDLFSVGDDEVKIVYPSSLIEGAMSGVGFDGADDFDVINSMRALVESSRGWSYRELEKVITGVLSVVLGTEKCKVSSAVWLKEISDRVKEKRNLTATSKF